ncbi:hypothetical protein ACFX13_034010 [Malus domestica]
MFNLSVVKEFYSNIPKEFPKSRQVVYVRGKFVTFTPNIISKMDVLGILLNSTFLVHPILFTQMMKVRLSLPCKKLCLYRLPRSSSVPSCRKENHIDLMCMLDSPVSLIESAPRMA